jgi:hypothetical protein
MLNNSINKIAHGINYNIEIKKTNQIEEKSTQHSGDFEQDISHSIDAGSIELVNSYKNFPFYSNRIDICRSWL